MRRPTASHTCCVISMMLLSCFLLAGSVCADEAARPDSTPTAHDAEFARFMEKSLAAKPAPPAAPAPTAAPRADPKSGATCEAADQNVQNYATIKRLEAELARLRAQQAAKWAEKGWTQKEAAAAGEPVVLNGTGYNIKSGTPGR